MAVNVNKLIEDAKKAQATARTAAEKAQAQAEKDKIDNETRARSKNQMDYADTLKPRLADYEAQLEIWANKIARGDKLSKTEQREFDKLVKDYNSVNKTIDAAIKKSNDILIEARRKVSSTPSATPSMGAPTGTPVQAPGAPVATSTTGIETTPAKTDKITGTPPPKKDSTKTPPPKVETPIDREAEALGAAATAADFALPETLFKNIPSLNAILKKYVNTPGMTTAALLKEIRNDLWYKQNSQEIKERYVQYYNYRDLQASGRAQGTTDYEMQINKIVASLTKKAAKLGSAAASDPAALRKAAENLYITNRSEDDSFITDFLAASIRPVSGMIGGKVTEGYSGEALANYKLLVTAARDNGFQVSDIIPGGSNEQQVLQGIASGQIDVNRVVADARKLASQGQPTYVRDLLSQGYSLKQVFAPYREVMANVLEIGDSDQIDLNDPLLRSAITDKGDMNLYDFRKSLRADNRWQYTDQARSDVSSMTLEVLRDFGFQG
jgi:hypothetical protein